MDPKKIVKYGYNKIAEKYHNWNNHLNENTNRLNYIEKLNKIIQDKPLQNQYNILDIGCASGIYTKKLLNIPNAKVTGIDISEMQIKLAKENIQEAQFLCEDIMKIEFSQNIFDIIVGLFSIIHLSPSEQLQIFPKLYNWIKPNGLLLINLSPNIDNGSIDANWLGTEMYWSSLGNDKFKTIIENLGFKILEWNILDEKEDDNIIKFLWILCKKL